MVPEVKKAGSDDNIHLCSAITYGNLKRLQMLIQKGADVNYINEDGQTPLGLAIMRANYPIALYLIQKGANVNAQIKDGTPLLLFMLTYYTITYQGGD